MHKYYRIKDSPHVMKLLGYKNLKVKFNWSAIVNALKQREEAEITISGKLNDSAIFEGTDTIKLA